MATPIDPPSEDETQQSLQRQITNDTQGDVAGWFPQSSVEASVSAFAGSVTTLYQFLVYTYLASTLRYAGKEITEEDIRTEGLDPAAVNLQLINSLQADSDLDAQAAEKGVTRDQGAYARGELEITFASNGESADAGLEVTAPDGDGGSLTYVTTEIAEAAENTPIVTVPIRAAVRGPDYNIGEERIGTIPKTSGVNASIQNVTNPNPIEGGEGPESNAELRERARGHDLEDANLKRRVITALNNTEGGGGVTEADVLPQEYPKGANDPDAQYNYSYFNLVIDYNGPTDADSLVDSDGDPVSGGLQGLVDAERSFGIAGYYVAPDTYALDVTADVAPAEPSQTTATAADIAESKVSQAVTNYLSQQGLDDDLYTAQLEQEILNADPNIAYLPSVTFDLTAPDGTTTTLSRNSRQAISESEKVDPGEVSIAAVPNPTTGG